MRSVQKTITAADNFLDRWNNYRRIQKIYFADQTTENLDLLRTEGKFTDMAAAEYEKERNATAEIKKQ